MDQLALASSAAPFVVETPPRERPKIPLHHLVTATVLPTVFVAAPLMVSVLLVPAIFVFEVVVACQLRSPRLLAARVAVIVAVVVAAGFMPAKIQDRWIVEALPTTPISIGAFNDAVMHGTIRGPRIGGGDAMATTPITFSSTRMPLRAFLTELSAQTGRRAWMGGCGNGASILFGLDSLDGYVELDP